jgi:hypothetical protein
VPSANHPPNLPRYERLASLLERRIRLGMLRAESPLPAQRDLMERFGVSLATVRRSLEVLDRRGLVHRIPGKGVYVAAHVKPEPGPGEAGYLGQPQALDLEGLGIGLVCLGWLAGSSGERSCLERVVRGAERAVMAGGGQLASVRHAPAQPSAGEILAVCRASLGQGALALLVVAPAVAPGIVAPLEELARRGGRPLAIVSCSGWGAAPVHCVAPNLREGARLLSQHLTEQGHTAALLIGDGEGGCPRLTAADWEPRPDLSLSTLTLGPAQGPRAADIAALARAITQGCTTFVTEHDRVADRVLGLLGEGGLPLPPEVTVIGFGDDFAYRHRHLTTVHYPYEEMGARAVDLLRASLYAKGSGHVANVLISPLLMRRGQGPAAPIEGEL